jgi:hypothetical protein
MLIEITITAVTVTLVFLLTPKIQLFKQTPEPYPTIDSYVDLWNDDDDYLLTNFGTDSLASI